MYFVFKYIIRNSKYKFQCFIEQQINIFFKINNVTLIQLYYKNICLNNITSFVSNIPTNIKYNFKLAPAMLL